MCPGTCPGELRQDWTTACASDCSAVAMGRRIRNAAPRLPSVAAEGRTSMLPPCRLTISFVTRNPNPVPTSFLVGEERIKDAVEKLWRNAGAAVFDEDFDKLTHLSFAGRTANGDQTAFRDCINRVRHQVRDCLPQFAGHSPHGWTLVSRKLEPDFFGDDTAGIKFEYWFDHCVKIDLLRSVRFAIEAECLTRNLSYALQLLFGEAEVFYQPWSCVGRSLGDEQRID